jgi:hypothetical protein
VPRRLSLETEDRRVDRCADDRNRAGLPSPRRYLTLARLTWAAWLGKPPGRTLWDIAHRLDVSTPQALHRHVRVVLGCSAAEFRRTATGRSMLARYRATLVAPYRATLRAFDPTAAEPTPRRVSAARVAVADALTGRAA